MADPIAPTVQWTMEEGSPFQRTFVWENDSGNAIDISGWTVRMQVRENPSPNATVILDPGSQGWITITDGPNGEFTLDIADTDTTDLGFDLGYFDIELDDGSASGTPGRVLQGTIKYDREVTR